MRNWLVTLVSGCAVALTGPLAPVAAGMVTGRDPDVSQDLVAVAECVETEAQAESLRRLDCPLAQGYHFSRPEEAEVIESLMHGGRKTLAA